MFKPDLRMLGYSAIPTMLCLLLDAMDFKVPAPLVRLLILVLGYYACKNNF